MQYFVHDDTQSSCDVVYKRAYENVAPHLRHGRGRQCRGEGVGGGLGSGQDGTGTECDVGSVSAEWRPFDSCQGAVLPFCVNGNCVNQLNCTPPACSPPHLPRGEDSDDSWCADDGSEAV